MLPNPVQWGRIGLKCDKLSHAELNCTSIFVSGMGFALLANLPPIYGLYTSFWCVLLYFIFGQSPHASFGTMAIMSIMISEATSSHDSHFVTNDNNPMAIESHKDFRFVAPFPSANQTRFHELINSSSPAKSNILETQYHTPHVVAKTMLVTMLTGIILIAMSLLKMNKVVAFIPISCISGFTTAAAFHIITSQFKFLLGISIPNHKGIFKLVKLWKEVALEVPKANLCDVVISVCCITFLFFIKEIVNIRYRHKLPVPIPAEMLVVTAVTLISHFGALNDRYGIDIINNVPAGFASPAVPNFTSFEIYLVDAFLIAVISFIISYSMVSTFARKHKYEVNTSREMMTYGICHLIGSCFGGFAAAAAPPRCTVLDTTGAKTQVVHMFTSLVLLLTILVIGPLFEPLPNSCLSSIIVCALIPLFKQFLHLAQFWKINKYDFAIWIVTWSSVVFMDIGVGLAVGVSFSVATVAVQACLSRGTILSSIGNIDLYQPSNKHELSEEIPGIKIFRFESSLHFASQAQFKEQLFQLTANPQKLPLIEIKNMKRRNSVTTTAMEKKLQGEERKEGGGTGGSTNSVKKGISDVYTIINENAENNNMGDTLWPDLTAIVLDFSSINYIDIMGLNLIKQLKTDYSHVGINLVLANCSGAIWCKLEAAGIGSDKHCECQMDIFPTIHDAVTSLSFSQKLQQACSGHSTIVISDHSGDKRKSNGHAVIHENLKSTEETEIDLPQDDSQA